MNPNAYNILKRIDLPIPKVFKIEDIFDSSPNNCYYLRYSSSENLVVSGKEIIDKHEKYKLEIDHKKLLEIEETFIFIGGGVSLIKSNFSYSEYVIGHPITLLRRGLCGGRFIHSNKKLLFLEQTFQGFEAHQEQKNEYKYMPTMGPSANILQRISDKIKRIIPFNQNGLLLEWLDTKKGIVFCDAKFYDVEKFRDELFSMPTKRENILVIGNINSKQVQNVQYDGFDIDYSGLPKNYAKLISCNSAILSHYITKSTNRLINLILR